MLAKVFRLFPKCSPALSSFSVSCTMCFTQHLAINNQTALGEADPQLCPCPAAALPHGVLAATRSSSCRTLRLCTEGTEKVEEWYFGSLFLARINDKPWQRNSYNSKCELERAAAAQLYTCN